MARYLAQIVIFISDISTRALRVPRAAHCKICKYVFARDGHWIPEHKRSASIYATGTREQRTVYRRVSRTSRECVCSFHGSLRVAEYRGGCCEKDPLRQKNTAEAIKYDRRERADLCLSARLPAQLNQIFQAALFIAIPRKVRRGDRVALIKTGP